MGYSEAQYAARESLNAGESRFNIVTAPLEDDRPIDWTPIWSLTRGCHVYLPTQLVYYSAEAASGDDGFYSFGCSNGNASGNTFEEAVLQGFLELVERDAIALWWYNRLSRRGVAIETFGDAYVMQIAEYYRDHHQRESWALDLTSDLGIPTFVAVSRLMTAPE
eukprot:gene19656-25147_t